MTTGWFCLHSNEVCLVEQFQYINGNSDGKAEKTPKIDIIALVFTPLKKTTPLCFLQLLHLLLKKYDDDVQDIVSLLQPSVPYVEAWGEPAAHSPENHIVTPTGTKFIKRPPSS